ncbi:uncharacterized protein LOC143233537 isoform X2 [Tachypleus tridentatus]|uniref:uncharacterized protein LOC143233537 isoform X2 n=1 Tax=Tachypleus tridentatus TaxID=6853 RepID=UPI003FD0102C
MSKKLSEVKISAFCVTSVVLVLMFIAFTTPNWLASDPRFYGADFVKLGLWETCFRSLASPHDLEQRKYYAGCSWIFNDEYRNLRKFLEPPFFVAVQVLFTFGFISLLLACVLLLALQICFPSEKEVLAMKLLSLLMLIAGICCTIALITFGARGDGRDWMPDPDHNYLSWSFGLGVVGAFLEYVVSLLFLVESRLAKKRLAIREQQNYNLEQNQNKMGTVI